MLSDAVLGGGLGVDRLAACTAAGSRGVYGSQLDCAQQSCTPLGTVHAKHHRLNITHSHLCMRARKAATGGRSSCCLHSSLASAN